MTRPWALEQACEHALELVLVNWGSTHPLAEELRAALAEVEQERMWP